MPGARRTHCLASKTKKDAREANTGTPKSLRHSLRNGFTAYSVLSPANQHLPPSPRGA
jgi:hypothetical protein